jgi:periplasmic copper chaperone A
MRIITRLTVRMLTMSLLATVAMLIRPSLALAGRAGVRVQNAWSRVMSAGGTGVGCLTIVDTGRADTLFGVSSPVAAGAAPHESVDVHGVMKMRPVGGLNVTPGKPVKLSPDGYHIMLIGLRHPPVAGGTAFPMMLTPAHAGRITTMAGVQKRAAVMLAMGQGSIGDAMPVSGMGSK